MKGKKILIVEDEKIFLESLVNFFQRKGIEAYGLETIEGAKELLKTIIFDLIITDYKLTDGLGSEFLTTTLVPISTKIVIITGFADLNDKTLLDMGAKLVIHKPISKQELFEKVVTIMVTNL
ncbi:MAG: response regulator [Oligoflexia bacterium]|nr:response regulator [Oligoflexia bacterium]